MVGEAPDTSMNCRDPGIGDLKMKIYHLRCWSIASYHWAFQKASPFSGTLNGKKSVLDKLIIISQSCAWSPSVTIVHFHDTFSELYHFNPHRRWGQSLSLLWKQCRMAEIDRALDSCNIICRTARCWSLSCEGYSKVRLNKFCASNLNHQIALWFQGSVQQAAYTDNTLTLTT